MKLVHEFKDGDVPVVLQQRGIDKFRVVYGREVCDNLNYAKACFEYGRCVFHSLACAGKLDNR